jgi:hypothetical protein
MRRLAVQNPLRCETARPTRLGMSVPSFKGGALRGMLCRRKSAGRLKGTKAEEGEKDALRA